MKKLHQFLPLAEHRFYSLNFLLVASSKADDAPPVTIVDISKKAYSAHYDSRDFQTFLFDKHISRTLAQPDNLRLDPDLLKK